MRLKSIVFGKEVELEIRKIKDYSKFGLYQVYRIEEDELVPLYKTCYTQLDILKIKNQGNCIQEEVFQ